MCIYLLFLRNKEATHDGYTHQPNPTSHTPLKILPPLGKYFLLVEMAFPIILLYVPNLLCYARIVLAFVGFSYATTTSFHDGYGDDVVVTTTDTTMMMTTAVFLWCFSAALDLFDGAVARNFHQTSRFGTLLDIVADNVLRTCMWMATASPSASSTTNMGMRLVAIGLVCTEWITMTCTQLLQAEVATKGQHRTSDNIANNWKDVDRNTTSSQSEHNQTPPPWWIKAIFKNNFRTPLGIWCIYGLFGAPLCAFLDRYHPIIRSWYIPDHVFIVAKYLSYCGRGVALSAELWFCREYLINKVVADDMKEREQSRLNKNMKQR